MPLEIENTSNFNALDRRNALSKAMQGSLDNYLKNQDQIKRFWRLEGSKGALFIREDKIIRIYWSENETVTVPTREAILQLIRDNPEITASILMLTEFFEQKSTK